MRTRNKMMTVLAVLLVASFARAAAEELGNGFLHHGVATPVSNHRGTVATVDGQGRNVVLVWLFDHRGGYALLMIDAGSGESQEIPMPFPPGGDCPYASILSSANKFYTHFNSHFVEFDPAKRAFTFVHQTAPQMAMSMTEDDRGVIWSVSYPNSGLVSYNPATGEFADYGPLNRENWLQYPRHIAADDQGWIYFGIGNTNSQILAFDPGARQVKEVVPAAERTQGEGYVYRNLDGTVYGHHPGTDNWYRFHAGSAERIGAHQRANPKPIIAGSQGLFHLGFPDGTLVRQCDLVDRVLSVENAKSGEVNEVRFDYTSEGAHIMGIATAPNGTVCGGTAFPMRFFSYDPATDQWINRESHGQWNTVARQGDHVFVGGYGGGFLLDWDPAREWVPTREDRPECNPRFLIQVAPTINRPHCLLAHPDGKTLVLAGTPGYGFTGGGLLFWDRQTKQAVVLKHTDVIPEHSTSALVALEGGKLLAGTTTAPGTGGEQKADQAELYILDMATKQLEWHAVVLPGVQWYTALCSGPNGLVFGIADHVRWFVFDPASRAIIHEENVSARLGPTVSQQGPRVFVRDTDGALYVLFVKGIAQVNEQNYEITLLAESPVPISPGGDILNGRIYFGSGSHLYSWGTKK